MPPPTSPTPPCTPAPALTGIALAVHPVCDGCGGGDEADGWRAGADGMQLCAACWERCLAGSGR